MRFQIIAGYTVIALATAACSDAGESKPPANATPKYDVLGIKLGEPIATARSNLQTKAFQKVPNSPYGPYECTSKADFMNKFKTERSGKVGFQDIDCEDEFKKDGYQAIVRYHLSPNGFVVTAVQTSFESPENRDQIVARLTQKFGMPTRQQPRSASWYVEPKEGRTLNKPTLSFEDKGDNYTMAMDAGYDIKNGLAEQISKELGQALGRSTEL